MGSADSAGVAWAGRSFEPNPSATDDGSAPLELIEAIGRFRAGEVGESHVVEVFRGVRLLIPLVAHLGDEALTTSGLRVDKSQELSIVTVEGPDGRSVLPVFSSVAAMARWNPQARPVPAEGVRVALAAANEGTSLVILDPLSETEFGIRRPALWAIARQEEWLPSYLDERVLEAFLAAAEPEPSIVAVQLAPADPQSRLVGAELLVHLSIVDGLDETELDAIIARSQSAWAASDVIAERVDSLAVRIASAQR
jgi:hypothetical protein